MGKTKKKQAKTATKVETKPEIVPAAKVDGLTFYPIPEFDDPLGICGAPASAYFNRHGMPEVPAEFTDKVESLFFHGGALPDLAPGVDRKKAGRALRAYLTSFAPPHEAKIATAGYALWVWSTPAAIAKATGEVAHR